MLRLMLGGMVWNQGNRCNGIQSWEDVGVGVTVITAGHAVAMAG